LISVERDSKKTPAGVKKDLENSKVVVIGFG
jgi:hypothetical protein